MIVAVKTKNGYLIGQDVTMNVDGIPLNESIDSNDPLFPLCDKGEAILAVDDSMRLASFFKYLPNCYDYGSLDFKTMVRKVIPNFYKECCNMHYGDPDNPPSFDCNMIIGRKKKAFGISKYGTCYEIGESEAIGKGEDSALGSLHVTRNDPDPMKRLLLAFYEARKRSHLVSLNLLIADTSKPYGDITFYEEYEILEKLKAYKIG